MSNDNAYTHTHTHTHTHKHACTCTHMHRHKTLLRTHTYTQTLTLSLTHTQTHTCTTTRPPTCNHTNTHQSQIYIVCSFHLAFSSLKERSSITLQHTATHYNTLQQNTAPHVHTYLRVHVHIPTLTCIHTNRVTVMALTSASPGE